MLGSRWVGESLHCRFDWAEVRPSIAVIESIGVYEDEVDGVAGGVGEPLYHYVDPEALDALVKSQTSTTITLHLDEYHITIRENTVRVSMREPAIQWTQ